MKRIKHYVDQIAEELDGAKEYAECYLDFKSDGESGWATKFKDMANDELRHAQNIHDLAVNEIKKLRNIYQPPQEMLDIWDKSHAEFMEKTAWIKTMLNM